MKNLTVYAYKNVYDRQNPIQVSFEDFIKNPGSIYGQFGLIDHEQKLNWLKNIKDKPERNDEKRAYLPAVDISNASILSIDIDGISDDQNKKQNIIEKLKKLPETFAVKESVSGNIVAFFKYECSASDFKFLYYKIYLELVLHLSVNIDFLPEIGRLRYVSTGETYYVNEQSSTLKELMQVDEIPYINTSVKKDKARGIIYGSK